MELGRKIYYGFLYKCCNNWNTSLSINELFLDTNIVFIIFE